MKRLGSSSLTHRQTNEHYRTVSFLQDGEVFRIVTARLAKMMGAEDEVHQISEVIFANLDKCTTTHGR